MKKILAFVCAAMMMVPGMVRAEETELLQNAGFETYEDKSNAMFGDYTEFAGWDRTGFSTLSEKSDVYEGAVALKLGATTAGSVYQKIEGLTDAYYAAGAPFRLTIHYKVVGMTSSGDVRLESYWEHVTSVDGLKDHDADKLQRVLSDTVQSEWQTLVIETTRPDKAKAFYLSFKTKAKCYVLLDSLSMVALPNTPADEPFIEVTPLKVTPVSTTIGNTATFETIHIKQGNVTGTTTFELSGYNYDQFSLSATEMPEGQNEIDLVITYAPTSAGTHTAILNIDNLNHTVLYQSVSLSGSCTDPSAKPTLTVTPSELPAFEILEGKQQTQTVTLSSVNCTDFVRAQVDHIQGAAFTVDGTMFSKNTDVTVTITFSPKEAGTFQSSLTFYSENAESVVVMLNGTGIKKTPETIDWQTDFVWNDANPLSMLNETFDEIAHGETFVKEGWQNVAAVDQRPWQGVDASTMQSIDGDGKFVRATAYQYGVDSAATWETWLVTPALDYKNAASQIFTFSVMGMYLPATGIQAKFELYFVDASDPAHVFFQLFEGLSIPQTADESGVWVPFQIHLENQANIPDAFHMAFRYTGPNGAAGAVAYYVDDVTWGVVTEGIESVQDSAVRTRKVLRDGQIYLVTEDATYDVRGARVEK